MSKEPKKLSKVFSAIAKKQGAKRAVSLPGPGLTHDHYVLEGTGRLLRVPRRNQLDMTPEDYLAHQKKVYEAARAVIGRREAGPELVQNLSD